ncbi:MAG: ABC transporter C-terminal domain-containing protein [Syntrophotaleaceae bacterium]
MRVKAATGDDSHSALRVEQAAETAPVADEQAQSEGQLSYADRRTKTPGTAPAEGSGRDQARIETLEQELADLETAMADPTLYRDADRWREVSDRHTRLKEEVEASYRQWEELQLAESA